MTEPWASRRRCRAWWLVWVVWPLPLVLWAAPASTQEAEPFRARNLNPLVTVFGLPIWEAPPRAGHQRTGVTLEAASHHRFSRRGADAVMIDGETWRTSVFHQRTVGQRWWVSVDVPHYRISGGVLDRLVDNWHSAFGLPHGGREYRSRNELLLRLENAEGAFFDLEQARNGLGDIQLGAGRAMGADGGLLLRASVTVPSGDQAMLAGGGGADWTVTVLRPRPVSFRDRRAGYYWGAGAMRLSDSGRVQFPARRWAYAAVVGGAWQLLPRAGAKVQIDLHRALYRAPLPEAGRTTVHGTFGGWWRPGGQAVIEYGVSEDLVVGASPDVVLHAGVRFGL